MMVAAAPTDTVLVIAELPGAVANPKGSPPRVKSPAEEVSLMTTDMLVRLAMSSFGLNAAAILAGGEVETPTNPAVLVSNTTVSPLTGATPSFQFPGSLQVPSTDSAAPVQCRIVGVTRSSSSSSDGGAWSPPARRRMVRRLGEEK